MKGMTTYSEAGRQVGRYEGSNLLPLSLGYNPLPCQMDAACSSIMQTASYHTTYRQIPNDMNVNYLFKNLSTVSY